MIWQDLCVKERYLQTVHFLKTNMSANIYWVLSKCQTLLALDQMLQMNISFAGHKSELGIIIRGVFTEEETCVSSPRHKMEERI